MTVLGQAQDERWAILAALECRTDMPVQRPERDSHGALGMTHKEKY